MCLNWFTSKKIEGFIQHLNRTCFTSISSYESHYAQYGKNTFYKRHLDQFKNENGRQFSVILYLNDEWKANDGGMLSMYPLNNPQVNIAPLGGRIVFFKKVMKWNMKSTHLLRVIERVLLDG